MQVIIPLNVRPLQEVEVVLSGQTYFFVIKYNVRIDSYTFDILDNQKEPIAQGVRVVPQYSLLSRYQAYANGRLPPGKLIAIDQSKTGTDAGYRDLGDRVLLSYDPDA